MSWWRRQRVALIALAVAAVATVGVHVWLDVLPSIPTESTAVTNVAENERVEVAGQTISLQSVRWEEFEAPDGMHTVTVRLSAGGGPEATWCRDFTLSESHGARVWLDARAELDVPYDAGESSCREESSSYKILAVFLVPEDVVGPFFFDIPGELDEVTRFTIEQ